MSTTSLLARRSYKRDSDVSSPGQLRKAQGCFCHSALRVAAAQYRDKRGWKDTSEMHEIHIAKDTREMLSYTSYHIMLNSLTILNS